MQSQRRLTEIKSETFRQRLAGLKSINPRPDFGPTLTVPAYEANGNGLNTRLNGYNQKVAEIDDEQNLVDTDESVLDDWNGRILSAVKAQYGPDSGEYEVIGGTRRNERKRPSRKGGGSTPLA